MALSFIDFLVISRPCLSYLYSSWFFGEIGAASKMKSFSKAAFLLTISSEHPTWPGWINW
ncbi:MAG: hypothetical protein IPL95_15535 [Saprospiraceae bacterium]|nr:hypothetical protein [Saprospiraceae bacterium]